MLVINLLIMKHFVKVIEQHLKGVAAEDKVFAEKLAARMSEDKNCMTQCCSYIINQVKNSGRQAFEDDEIYGMAIHYIDEGIVEKAAAPKVHIVVPGRDESPKPKVEVSKKTAKKPVVQDDAQLSLF